MADYDRTEITKVIGKIKKMLDMAAGKANEHESAVAASMAAKLMKKYELEMADIIVEDLQKNKDEVVKEAASNWSYKTSWPSWMQFLIVEIGRTFDCHTKIEWVMDEAKGEYRRKIFFFGYKPDVEVATYVSTFLLTTIGNLAYDSWNANKHRTTASAPAYKTSFSYGAYTVIAGRLRELKETEEKVYTSTGTSLVVVKEDAIEAKFGKFEYSKGRVDQVVSTAYYNGQDAGKNIPLRRAVKTDPQTAGLLS